MAFLEEAHVNDIGTIFRVTIYDTTSTGGSVIADVSGASAITYTFKRPNGTTFSRTGTFTSDGTDGKMQYSVVTDDFDEAGSYKLQGKVVISDGTFYTDIHTFKVHRNL